MWNRLKHWFSRHALGITLTFLILGMVFTWLTPTIFVFIPSGHAGVYWVRLGGGTVTDDVLSEGISFKLPWDKIFIYNIRLQQNGGTFSVLTSDGLHVSIDMTVRYRLIKPDLGILHKNIGPDYVNTLLLPELNSHVRQEISKYTPEQLYSTHRERIEEAIFQNLVQAMRIEYLPEVPHESFIHVENLLVKAIVLPKRVQASIEDKQLQLHLMLGYDYRVQREQKEKQRKRIEAEGIRDFQNIVSEGISEQYLKWKGITATLELATSNNAKVVVIGAGEGGLPIILGNLDQPLPKPQGVDSD